MPTPGNSSPDFKVPTPGNNRLAKVQKKAAAAKLLPVEAAAEPVAIAVPGQNHLRSQGAHQGLLVTQASPGWPEAKAAAGHRQTPGMLFRKMLAVVVARAWVAAVVAGPQTGVQWQVKVTWVEAVAADAAVLTLLTAEPEAVTGLFDCPC